MIKTIAYEGKKLSYSLKGQGRSVVLLHGFGEDGNIWKHQVAFFEPFYQLIIPHLPGSGSSEMIGDMSMEGLAESIHVILQHENIQKCVLIGHSMGGYIALAFAEKYPGLLCGLGLFHSSAFADTAEKIATRKKGIEQMKEKGAYVFLQNATPKLYSDHTRQNHPQLIEDHIKSVDYFTKEALVAYYEAMIQRPDRTAILKQNKMPVLFVLGRTDVAVPLDDGLKQVHLPAISYIHVLEKSGHMGMVEEIEQSCFILKNYLSEVL